MEFWKEKIVRWNFQKKKNCPVELSGGIVRWNFEKNLGVNLEGLGQSYKRIINMTQWYFYVTRLNFPITFLTRRKAPKTCWTRWVRIGRVTESLTEGVLSLHWSRYSWSAKFINMLILFFALAFPFSLVVQGNNL